MDDTGVKVQSLCLGIEGTDAFISIGLKDESCEVEFSDCGKFSLSELEEIVRKAKRFLTYNFEEDVNHECKCHKPVIPTFEEIEKEIEESDNPYVSINIDAHGNQSIRVVNEPNPLDHEIGSIEEEQKPPAEEPLPKLKPLDSGPEKSDESENDIVKSRLRNKVKRPEMIAVSGHDLLSYAVVDQDVVIQYGGTKVTYITIEKLKQIASSQTLHEDVVTYFGAEKPANYTSALRQFAMYVRDGVVNLEPPKVEEITPDEITQEEVKSPSKPPRKIPPTLSHEMLRRKGLL